MNSDDGTGPAQWSTTSPEHLDRLALGVLRAARDAARELRREPPDPDRQTWALGVLAGQTQAMLGPGMPDHPPVGAEAREGFVRTALALAVHVRAHSWAKADLGAAGVPGQNDVPHAGELRSADTFDVLGRLLLPNTSPEGWTATLVTDLARGDQKLEAAVKLGKYVLHPTFLALTDDTTRVIGEALHNINVRRLGQLADELRHWAGAAAPPLPEVPRIPTPIITETVLDEVVGDFPWPSVDPSTVSDEVVGDFPWPSPDPSTVSDEVVVDFSWPSLEPSDAGGTAFDRMPFVDEPDGPDIDPPTIRGFSL
ncbi:hypothetical protein [Streptomyces adonidis]|uniref:hypothetical protein n=1 Tax=Streptomyces adonidis TaxID=3231367 RepID=UPI0034DB79F3